LVVPGRKKFRTAKRVTALQIAAIAVDTLLSTKTVAKVYGGGGSATSHERCCRSSLRLGLPLPPERAPSKLRDAEAER
jgi:hypothetical protein